MTVSTQSKKRELAPGFVCEVDRMDEAAWCRVLEDFGDANIYQTWTYDEVRAGRKNISHLLLKKNGEVVAGAQARTVKLPFLQAGIAYVRWGPFWRRRGREADPEIFRQAIRALRNEYACRRGLVLRLFPALFRNNTEFLSILDEEGFGQLNQERPDRTLLLDITRPLEELRAGLRQHWRRYLKVAERNNLEILEGTQDEFFEMFVGIYREMVSRKKFVEPNDIREFREIQRRLPENLKMKIMLCKANGTLCSGVICSAVGNTGIYLYGATSNLGLKARGSYLLHWKLIEWLKQKGVSTYDLHGINPVENPGTYKFKSDLCGDHGQDVVFMGRFDTHSSAWSHAWVTLGDRLRQQYRALHKAKQDKAEAEKPGGQQHALPHSGERLAEP
jgi:Acetyltransferase (GNAT) domain